VSVRSSPREDPQSSPHRLGTALRDLRRTHPVERNRLRAQQSRSTELTPASPASSLARRYLPGACHTAQAGPLVLSSTLRLDLEEKIEKRKGEGDSCASATGQQLLWVPNHVFQTSAHTPVRRCDRCARSALRGTGSGAGFVKCLIIV
jgi:hypothetical protein